MSLFTWLFGNNKPSTEPVVKTIGTIIECNASECMDNFEGQCILTNIDLTKSKLSSDNTFTCSEYSVEDAELKKDFIKEVSMRG